jgi:nitroreductase
VLELEAQHQSATGEKAMNVLHAPSGSRPEPAQPALGAGQHAAEAAIFAPSVHNTQPWQFGVRDDALTVRADPARRLAQADPQGREMLISCGAAVFTCRVALRQLGYVPAVSVLPDPDQPLLAARIAWADQVPPVEFEQRLFAEVKRRRTHRGGFRVTPLPAAAVTALQEEAAIEGAALRVISDHRALDELAAVVRAAERAIQLDPVRAAELAAWTLPPGSSRRDGVPAGAYPAASEPTQPDFPGRDFAAGRGWGAPSPGGLAPERTAGTVCILTTNVDDPRDWIAAGQALQRVLLCASSYGVAVALHTQPLEFPSLREFVRLQLSQRAHPQLVVRLGVSGRMAVSVRRPVGEVLI